MISKNQIKYVSTSACSQGEKVVSLSLLAELRQQLKDKLTKLSKTQSIYENVTWAEIDDIIDEVLCVEGENSDVSDRRKEK